MKKHKAQMKRLHRRIESWNKTMKEYNSSAPGIQKRKPDGFKCPGSHKR